MMQRQKRKLALLSSLFSVLRSLFAVLSSLLSARRSLLAALCPLLFSLCSLLSAMFSGLCMALKETKDWYGSKRNQGLGDRDRERRRKAREASRMAALLGIARIFALLIGLL